ncbi:MAG TPA: tetratricopeptide repeat protein [Pyrinomonadaceae bacterium]|jgi:predicted Zn-dependent protease
MTKRIALVLATVTCFLVVISLRAPVSAKDAWTSVRSKNFLLVGNASEKDIRQVGIRLEQFREVFSRLFTNLTVNSPVPATVIVFKNDTSYRPFKLNANSAGFFQPGPDVNYITLKLETDSSSEQDPYTIIFHEYTHLLVENTSSNVPTWFNEGLAEYYSTFSITDDQKVVMGKPIASHVYRLRENRMLPLRTLFQVDQNSPHYNERDKQSIFYAESWALMHYLILGNNGQRMTQLSKFVDLLSAGMPMERAFQQAFATTFESMEKELRAYIQRDRYPVISGHFTSKLGYDTTMESAPISEAEAQAYLGDLLLHSNRTDSEAYLQKALALDPDLAMANASMGMLRVRQGKSDEARKSLERAVAANSQNYLIHYYYAYALSREGNRDMETVMGFAPETAAKMRSELKRAIQLRPDFPESYSLLAFVNLVTNSKLDESLELLKHALAISPGRNDLVFMMAQLYMHKEDFKTAHQLIDKLIGNNNDADTRQRAQALLAQLVSVEEQLARIGVVREEQAADAHRSSTLREFSQTDADEKYDPAAALRESLRRPAARETQAQGTLVRIDCDGKSITFIVKINGRPFKLHTDSFQHMDIFSFSEDAGSQVTCGLRKPENNVVICYLPPTDPRAKIDGVIKSIEFVPPDFKLKP